MSGEDWTDVEMVLSTATPSLVAKAPKLDPLTIKLGAPVPTMAAAMSAADSYRQVQESRVELERLRGAVTNAPEAKKERNLAMQTASRGGSVGRWSFDGANTAEADEGLNKVARDLQLMDFNNSLNDLKRKDNSGPKSVEGVSVSYRLANRTSLPSRSDRQLI